MSKQFILLVEDDPVDLELIVRALRQSGIDAEIAVARDGSEALQFLFATGPHSGRDLGELPALVLLDLSLPRVGGLEVLRRVRANRFTRHVPVVVVTGAWNPKQIVAGFRLQADGFICKGTDFNKLTESLGNLALDVLLEEPNQPVLGGTGWRVRPASAMRVGRRRGARVRANAKSDPSANVLFNLESTEPAFEQR